MWKSTFIPSIHLNSFYVTIITYNYYDKVAQPLRGHFFWLCVFCIFWTDDHSIKQHFQIKKGSVTRLDSKWTNQKWRFGSDNTNLTAAEHILRCRWRWYSKNDFRRMKIYVLCLAIKLLAKIMCLQRKKCYSV